jgi:hypothetical protein
VFVEYPHPLQPVLGAGYEVHPGVVATIRETESGVD